jgi:flagellar protein FlaG
MFNNIVNNGFQATAQAKEPKTTTPVDPPQEKEPADQLEQQIAKEPTVELSELNFAVSKLNDYVQNIQRTLAFSVEEATGITVVQVYDTETKELIRQIPAEETIKLAASIAAKTASLFLQEQA